MINEYFIEKIAAKYMIASENDLNFVFDEKAYREEVYQKCMSDPECYAKYREEARKRQKDYHARQLENLSDEYAKRRKTHQEARQSLRSSDSLEGLSSNLSQKIQSLKSDLIKKIKARILSEIDSNISAEDLKFKVENFPAYREFARDLTDLYYLRDKVKEYAIMLDGATLPLEFSGKKMGNSLKKLNEVFIKTYGDKYKNIAVAVSQILNKINSMLG